MNLYGTILLEVQPKEKLRHVLERFHQVSNIMTLKKISFKSYSDSELLLSLLISSQMVLNWFITSHVPHTFIRNLFSNVHVLS